MDLFDAMKGRRAVRAYTGAKVPKDTVRSLLELAAQAPSAMNLQPWAFAIVQDPAVLRRLSDTAKREALASMTFNEAHHGLREAMASPDFSIFYDAGTLIVVCANSSGPFAAGDCCLAAQNLMLAAHAMGLATCPIGLSLPALRQPGLKRELGIPAGYLPVFALVLGSPREHPEPTPRHTPEVVAWLEAP